MNHEFDFTTVDKVFNELSTLKGITRVTISYDAVYKAQELLELEGKSFEEVTAIRNAVVYRFSKRHNPDLPLDEMTASMYLSAITAAIDDWKWNHDMPV